MPSRNGNSTRKSRDITIQKMQCVGGVNCFFVFLTFYCFQESFREAVPPEKRLDWGDHCDSWHSPKRDRAKLFHLHGARLIEKQKPACDGTHFTDVGKFAQQIETNEAMFFWFGDRYLRRGCDNFGLVWRQNSSTNHVCPTHLENIGMVIWLGEVSTILNHLPWNAFRVFRPSLHLKTGQGAMMDRWK